MGCRLIEGARTLDRVVYNAVAATPPPTKWDVPSERSRLQPGPHWRAYPTDVIFGGNPWLRRRRSGLRSRSRSGHLSRRRIARRVMLQAQPYAYESRLLKMFRKKRNTLRTSRKIDAAIIGAELTSRVLRSR